MKRIGVTRYLSLFVVALAMLVARGVAAQTAVLESAALRLELSASPYSYSVIEKSTGTVLATESQTQFTVGSAQTVTGATVTSQTATKLDATLALSGTSSTAHATFTFQTPEIIQVK